MTVQYEEEYEKCSDIIDADPSSHEEVTKKKEKTSSRRMMSRIQYQYMKGSSYFHHALDGNIMGYKAGFAARGFSWKECIEYEMQRENDAPLQRE